jgi:toxin ParE1/3/4
LGSHALSRAAVADIEQIALHSFRQGGRARAEIYIAALHDAFNRLAQFPELGRDARHVRPGCRAFEVGSHVAFYRADQTDIVILRVLHARMAPRNHL